MYLKLKHFSVSYPVVKECGNCQSICKGTNVQFCTKHKNVEWQKYDQWTLCIPGKCEIDIENYRPEAKVFKDIFQTFRMYQCCFKQTKK